MTGCLHRKVGSLSLCCRLLAGKVTEGAERTILTKQRAYSVDIVCLYPRLRKNSFQSLLKFASSCDCKIFEVISVLTVDLVGFPSFFFSSVGLAVLLSLSILSGSIPSSACFALSSWFFQGSLQFQTPWK